MVSSCVAYGCQNVHVAKQPLTFHSFPFKRPEILELWIKAIKRENWQPTKASRLCGAHFLKTDFYCLPFTKRILLKSDAVPSIFSVPATPTRRGRKRAYTSNSSEEATENIGDNKAPKEKPGVDDILVNQLHEEAEATYELVREGDIEHDNDTHNHEFLDDTEAILGYDYDSENPPKTQMQTDSGTEEPMDDDLICGLPSTSTNESTSLSAKTFADVAVLTTEHGNTVVEELKTRVKQLHQVIRRRNIKIACLEEVIKELCDTAFES